mgnify:CR=1 FL=1
MHNQKVVYQRYIPSLPENIKTQFVRKLYRNSHVCVLNGCAIAKADGFFPAITGIFPAAKGGYQLIKKHTSAIYQLANRWQYWGDYAK